MSTWSRPTATPGWSGYLVGMLVNALLLFLVNVRPGWQAVPFLTADAQQVLPMVNASIVAGVLANAVYLVKDDRWLRALGELVTTAVGIAALVRLWTVYPFDYVRTSMPWDMPWDLLTRTVLVFALAVSAVALVVALVRLAPRHGDTRPDDGARSAAGDRAGG